MITMRVMGPSPGTRADVAPPLSPLRPRPVGAAPLRSASMGLYAAYGSNMDPAQMLRRCPASPHTGTGWIRGWRLTFGGEEYGWEGALATLVPDDDGPGVFVALYDLTETDQQALDAFEGGLPSARHLGGIADAAEAAGAPDDYVAELRSRECRTAF